MLVIRFYLAKANTESFEASNFSHAVKHLKRRRDLRAALAVKRQHLGSLTKLSAHQNRCEAAGEKMRSEKRTYSEKKRVTTSVKSM